MRPLSVVRKLDESRVSAALAALAARKLSVAGVARLLGVSRSAVVAAVEGRTFHRAQRPTQEWAARVSAHREDVLARRAARRVTRASGVV
jgi:predicted transcriptional regulator